MFGGALAPPPSNSFFAKFAALEYAEEGEVREEREKGEPRAVG